MPVLDPETPDAYRKRAEELRTFAESLSHGPSRAQLFDLAGKWDDMARNADGLCAITSQSRQSIDRSRALLERINKSGL